MKVKKMKISWWKWFVSDYMFLVSFSSYLSTVECSGLVNDSISSVGTSSTNQGRMI